MNEQKTATLEGVEPIKYTVNVDHHEARKPQSGCSGQRSF